MPDISMCNDDGCPSRHECRRHKASGTEPGMYQSWIVTERGNKQRCADFWYWPRSPGEVDGEPEADASEGLYR